MAKSKAQRALSAGPSKIGAKARAVASSLKGAARGKHAKMDYSAARKNAEGFSNAPSMGKHSKEAAERTQKKQYTPKHAGGMSLRQAVDSQRVQRNQGKTPGKVLNMNEAMATRSKGRKQEGSTMSLQEAVSARRGQRNRGKVAP